MNTRIATFLCATLLALAADAGEQGKLLGVRAATDGQASTLEIEGDRPLSFTTLKLSGPPRVVVDFADAEVGTEQRELEVEDGTLRRAALAQAGSRTARVVIELVTDAEFEVRADGNKVQVRVPHPAVAGATPEPPLPAPAESPPPTEAEKVASLPTVSLVGSRPAEAPPDARTERQRTALEKAEAVKKALAEKRALAEQQKRDKAEQRQRAAAERAARKLAAAERKRTGKSASPPPAPAPALAANEPPPRAEPPPADEPPGAPVTPPPQPAPATEPRHPGRPQRLSEARHITGIGFRPVGGGEVIVRSDQPLEYGISAEGTAVLLHLPSAAIPLTNNRRPLDTQFFAGAVQRVVPLPVEGGTDVRIELRERAGYQLAQTGSVLTVTFSAPQ